MGEDELYDDDFEESDEFMEYPVGAIAALSVWVWTCAMPEKEQSVNLGLSVSDEDFLKAMGVRG